MRKAISALTAAIALLLVARPAHADPGLPGLPSKTVAAALHVAHLQQAGGLVVDGVVVAGRKLNIRASGCPPTSPVKFFLDDTGLGSTTADSEGVFDDQNQRIPYATPSGPHELKATCSRTIGPVMINVFQPNTTPPHGRSGTLAVSRSAVTPGRTIALSGRSCKHGPPAASLGGTKLVLAAPVRSGGLLKASATIPQDTPAGSHQLLTRCNGQVAGVATLRVMAPAQMLPYRAGAARTNLVPGLSAGVALILVLVGALTLVRVKRHRIRTATPGYFDLPGPDR